jgi:aspartate-semialdehyde dehydrogenase
MIKYKVGIIGATGMVGQRFVTLISEHPWFELAAVAASSRSAGRTYEEAVKGRWMMSTPLPQAIKKLVVMDAVSDINKITDSVNFVFSAVDMKKDEIMTLEEAYAKSECPVISNNSAHRLTPDVPMIIPEINAEHIEVIGEQRKRLGTKRGFIIVKSNCSIMSYVPAFHPLKDKFGLERALVCTYQAISGASKTFDTWPEMIENVIPYIGGEEAKSEREPLKIWGKVADGTIVPAASPSITTQCIRVPVADGHMAAAFMSFVSKPDIDEIKSIWADYRGLPQALELPSAPKQFLHYFEDENRPQSKLDCMLENGMAISLGRLRPDTQYDYKFIGLSHNTLRGAAGGAVLTAELLCKEGHISNA